MKQTSKQKTESKYVLTAILIGVIAVLSAVTIIVAEATPEFETIDNTPELEIIDTTPVTKTVFGNITSITFNYNNSSSYTLIPSTFDSNGNLITYELKTIELNGKTRYIIEDGV